MEVGNSLFFKVLTKAFSNYSLKEFTPVMVDLCRASDAAVMYFLQELIKDECDFVVSVLLCCTDKLSRTYTEVYLTAAVNRAFEIEAAYIDEEEEVEVETEEEDEKSGETKQVKKTIKRPKALAVRFLDYMYHNLFNFGPSNWTRLDSISLLLKNLLMGGKPQLQIFMRHDSIKALTDFMLG